MTEDETLDEEQLQQRFIKMIDEDIAQIERFERMLGANWHRFPEDVRASLREKIQKLGDSIAEFEKAVESQSTTERLFKKEIP